MGIKLGHAKFQPSTPREHFQIGGLNRREQEKFAFPTENWLHHGNGEKIRRMLLIITNRKSDTPCQIR